MGDQVKSSAGGARLGVSGRSVARYLGLTPDAVQRAADAGLLTEEGGLHDAEEVLELGKRGFVTPTELRMFPAESVLLVQQAHARADRDEEFPRWREAWGWSAELSETETLKSASAWWPIAPEKRAGVTALVSTVASFVVTIAVVDPDRPVVRVREDGRVHLNTALATVDTYEGKTLLRVFAGKRIPLRRGSNFLIPTRKGAE